MADTTGLYFPKGPTRKQLKAKADRDEARTIAAVRALAVRRDGYCRFAGVDVGPCEGPSEWAHVGDGRRFKTRGMAPEDRHSTKASMMLCRRHHGQFDGRRSPRLAVLTRDPERGCNGALMVSDNPSLSSSWRDAPVPFQSEETDGHL